MVTLLGGETEDVSAVPGLVSRWLPLATSLVMLGMWYAQSAHTAQAVEEVKVAIAVHSEHTQSTYQRKDVAAEQYKRLEVLLARIEQQLTDAAARRR